MIANVAEKQKSILNYLLKTSKTATADDLVMHLGITKTAIKGHINRLVDLGLLIYKDEKGLVGRPSRHYSLSEAGVDTFPRQYSWLSNQMLEQLSEHLTSDQLAAFMRSLADRVFDQHKSKIESDNEDTRLRNLKNLLNELGYQVELRKNARQQKVIIEAFNCVYHSVAKKHTELCQFDLQLIKKSSQMVPVLESCIAKGGLSCRFCLTKK